MLQNSEIRSAAKAAGVMLWQLADVLGVSEATIMKKLCLNLYAGQSELHDYLEVIS